MNCAAQLSCRLAWDASPSSSVAGYRVYHGIQSRNYAFVQSVGTNLSCVISNLQPGVKYYIALTAYTSNQLESDFSEELVFLVEQASKPFVRLHTTLKESSDLVEWSVLEAPVTDIELEEGMPSGFYKFRRLRLETVEHSQVDAPVIRLTPVFARSFDLVNWTEFDGTPMDLVADRHREFFDIVRMQSELKQPP